LVGIGAGVEELLDLLRVPILRGGDQVHELSALSFQLSA
jgi:hypothetical protein